MATSRKYKNERLVEDNNGNDKVNKSVTPQDLGTVNDFIHKAQLLSEFMILNKLTGNDISNALSLLTKLAEVSADNSKEDIFG